MKHIKSFDELKQLSAKEKFFVVSDGSYRSYIFFGVSPVSNGVAVAIDDSNYKKATCFTDTDFIYGRSEFIRGEYDSKEMGKIMVRQLEERILSINKIWLNSEPNPERSVATGLNSNSEDGNIKSNSIQQ